MVLFFSSEVEKKSSFPKLRRKNGSGREEGRCFFKVKLRNYAGDSRRGSLRQLSRWVRQVSSRLAMLIDGNYTCCFHILGTGYLKDVRICIHIRIIHWETWNWNFGQVITILCCLSLGSHRHVKGADRRHTCSTAHKENTYCFQRNASKCRIMRDLFFKLIIVSNLYIPGAKDYVCSVKQTSTFHGWKSFLAEGVI